MADTTMQIAMDRVHIIPGFNARLDITPESVADLAQDIKAKGLLNPVTLRPMKGKEGHYELIAGHRRYAAHELLKEQFIFSSVREMDDRTAAAANLSENAQRKDLTPFEIAHKSRELRDKFNENGSTIAAMIGNVSKSYVNNLLRVLDNVDPRILKEWRNGHHIATVDYLVYLAGFVDGSKKPDHKRQWSEWAKACKALEAAAEDAQGIAGGDDDDEGDEDPEEGGGGSGGAAPRTRNPKRPRLEYLNEAAALIRKADPKVFKGTEPGEIALACLNFARGIKPRIVIGDFSYDPKAEPDAVKDKDEPKKAAKGEGKPKAKKEKGDKSPKNGKASGKGKRKAKGEAQPSA